MSSQKDQKKHEPKPPAKPEGHMQADESLKALLDARLLIAAATLAAISVGGVKGFIIDPAHKAQLERRAADKLYLPEVKDALDDNKAFIPGEVAKAIPTLPVDAAIAKYIDAQAAFSEKAHLKFIDLPLDLTQHSRTDIGINAIPIGGGIWGMPSAHSEKVPGLRFALTPMVNNEDFVPGTVYLGATEELGNTHAAVGIVENEAKTQRQYVLDIQSTNRQAPPDAKLIAWIQPVSH